VTANPQDVTSSSFTPSAAGTYYWIASYSGDANNTPVSGSCGDIGESSVVQPVTPGVTTHPAVLVINNDSATLTGLSNGVAPTGDLTFKLYQGADCSGAIIKQQVVTLTSAIGAGPYTTTFGILDALSVTADTTFRWIVSYSGDGNYNAVSSACSAESAAIDITP